MRSKHLSLLCVVSFLGLSIMTSPAAEAASFLIPNGVSVSAADVSIGDMEFQGATGTFNVLSGLPFVGNVLNSAANTGTLVLSPNSELHGTVGATMGALSQIILNGNATTIGSISSQTLSLGQNTLTSTGAMSFPSGAIVNTKVISNALFGNVANTGTDSIAGPYLTVNVDASGVIILAPNIPLKVIDAQGGTATIPVHVTSDNALYGFIGNFLDGQLTVTPTLNSALILPSGVGSVFTSLLTVAANHPGSDIANVVAALSALPSPTAIETALAQLNPNVDGAIPRASFAGAQQFQNLWSKHMGYGRCIYATDCDRHVEKQPRKEKIPEGECAVETNCSNVANQFELWVDGFAYFGHQYARDGFQGYNDNIYGGMIGFQGPINRELSLGVGGGYAQGVMDRRGNDDRIQIYDATAYASYDSTHWYLDGAFSFDYNVYDGSRHIDFPGIDRTAKSHYKGEQYTALAASGYRWYSNDCFMITPLASLQYSYLHVNKYKEYHAGDLDLCVRTQHYNFLESSLGLKVSRPFQTKYGVFVPEIHAMWLYDFFGDKMKLTSTFSGVAAEAGSFEVKGPGWARNSGNVGASIAWITCKDLGIQFTYNYEFSSSYHANDGLIKLSKRF